MDFKSKYDWSVLVKAFNALSPERQKELVPDIDTKTIEHVCLKSEEYENDSPLHLAASYGLADVCRYYLDKGIKVDIKNRNGWTPLHFAAKSSSGICRILLQKGANPLARNKNADQTPFHNAAGNKETCPVFLELGLDPNIASTAPIFKGNTPFLAAVSFNDLATLEIFLKHGGDVHHFDGDGESALFRAARFLDKDKFRSLIKYGADPNETGPEGKTLIHFMMTESFNCLDKEQKQKHHDEHAAFLEWLIIEYKLSCDTCDKKGNTPLLVAAANGSLEYLPVLLKYGAGLNVQNAKKETALHRSFEPINQQRQKAAVEYFLAAGIDPRIKISRGKTALDLAQASKRTELVDLIQTSLIQWKDKPETKPDKKPVVKESPTKKPSVKKTSAKKTHENTEPIASESKKEKLSGLSAASEKNKSLPEIINLNHYPATVSRKHLDALHKMLGTTLPEYDDFISKYGEGITSYTLRVYMPDRILEENESQFRSRWTEYYLWDDEGTKLDSDDLTVATILADSIEGDEFVWFPGRQGVKTKPGIYILPRNAYKISRTGTDLSDVFRYMRKLFRDFPKDFCWHEGFKNISLQKYVHPGNIPITFPELTKRIEQTGTFEKTIVGKKTATFFSSSWGGLFDLDYNEKTVFIRCDKKTNLSIPHSLLIDIGFVQIEKDKQLYN